MALKFTDVGAGLVLTAYLKNGWPAGGKDLTIHLYKTNTALSDTNVLGDFTENGITGGGGKTLSNGAGWTVQTAAPPPSATYSAQTWTFTAAFGDTIYGYYIIDADSNLLWAEALTAPFTPANNGDQLTITPKLCMSEGTPS